jgi:hypothetical protein
VSSSGSGMGAAIRRQLRSDAVIVAVSIALTCSNVHKQWPERSVRDEALPGCRFSHHTGYAVVKRLPAAMLPAGTMVAQQTLPESWQTAAAGERITMNTLIRVAVALLLSRARDLKGVNEEECEGLFVPGHVANGRPARPGALIVSHAGMLAAGTDRTG